MNNREIGQVLGVLVKEAALPSEIGGSIVTNTLPFGPYLSLAGTAAGLLRGSPSRLAQTEAYDRSYSNFIPGVGDYRLARRGLRAAEDTGSSGSMLSELIGPATSTLLSGIVGAGLGRALDGSRGMYSGAGLGLLAGAGLNAIGALPALLTKTRNLDEQKRNDKNTLRTILKYILPGLGSYDRYKRYGYTRAYDEMGDKLRAKRILNLDKEKVDALNEVEQALQPE